MEVRDVHSSHYRADVPHRDPRGPNIGLIGSLASFARVNAFGFIETPYRRVIDGKVTDQIDYLTADEEDRFSIAQANAAMDSEGRLTEERVLVRIKHGDVDTIPAADVEYMDVSPPPDGFGGHRADPVPRARRRFPGSDGCEHAAPGCAADP